MTGLEDMVTDDEFQKELVWVLSQRTDLTQAEIADVPFVQKSQPTVSRILGEYDPAVDGFEWGSHGYDMEEADLESEAVENYREAVADAMFHSPLLGHIVKMADASIGDAEPTELEYQE